LLKLKKKRTGGRQPPRGNADEYNKGRQTNLQPLAQVQTGREARENRQHVGNRHPVQDAPCAGRRPRSERQTIVYNGESRFLQHNKKGRKNA
jgi:hypothetical protein